MTIRPVCRRASSRFRTVGVVGDCRERQLCLFVDPGAAACEQQEVLDERLHPVVCTTDRLQMVAVDLLLGQFKPE
jgi:hypothetical protein